MRKILAGEVRCPECGEGFRDIPQELILWGDERRASSALATATQSNTAEGYCRGGHRLSVYVSDDPPSYWVRVLRGPDTQSRRSG